jgi:hypothetical protein
MAAPFGQSVRRRLQEFEERSKNFQAISDQTVHGTRIRPLSQQLDSIRSRSVQMLGRLGASLSQKADER